jgi:hypothetical protein
LLSKSFGLDHSFDVVSMAVESILLSKDTVSAEEFVNLVAKYGSISCYEIIPPDELEICVDEKFSLDGAFVPLRDYR